MHGRPTAPTPCARPSTAAARAGTVSIPGVYGGFLDKFPFGAAFGKGLTFKMGQTHVHNYMRPAARPHRDAARSTRRSSSPTASRSTTPRRLPDLPRQAGRLHQGRHAAERVRRRRGPPAGGRLPTQLGWPSLRPPSLLTTGWAEAGPTKAVRAAARPPAARRRPPCRCPCRRVLASAHGTRNS